MKMSDSDENKISRRGGFGWSEKVGVFIPYFFRGNTKYCSTRMVDILGQRKFGLPAGTSIHGTGCSHITELEARLLNEVNIQHTRDKKFGANLFTCWDTAMPLTEAAAALTALKNSFGKTPKIILFYSCVSNSLWFHIYLVSSGVQQAGGGRAQISGPNRGGHAQASGPKRGRRNKKKKKTPSGGPPTLNLYDSSSDGEQHRIFNLISHFLWNLW